MAKVKVIDEEPLQIWFDCPACKHKHIFDKRWTFNGDVNKPTFSPSLLCRWAENGVQKVCHSFVKDGNIQFLGDCTHELANKTVEIPELED
jgi:hypothetical protein